jgi:A/G-specific adenine glycosylase
VQRTTTVVVLRDGEGRFLLLRRPPAGVWGGLWTFPEIATGEDPLRWCEQRLGVRPTSSESLRLIRHGFTHYDLDIKPVLIEIPSRERAEARHMRRLVMEGTESLWYNPHAPASLGLPAPVAELIAGLAGSRIAVGESERT